jgi:hypothetical protein
MEATASVDTIGFFLLAIFPGLVSLQVYRLLMPARPLAWQDVFVQALFYSCLNFALLSPLAFFIMKGSNLTDHPVGYWLVLIATLLAFPIAWPFVLRALLRWNWLKRRIQLPFPTPWDFFFYERKPVFALVHLKGGRLLGGYWGGRSYAGSFPNDGEIYLEAVYSLNDKGVFGQPIDGTQGTLIHKDQYDCIEFLEVPPLPVNRS